jgi:hypothetical protein
MTIYYVPPNCFEGVIEDLDMEKRVTKLENGIRII